MKNIPFLLIYSRIVLAIVITLIAVFDLESTGWLIVILMIFGILTDVFDGIIARKLGVSSEKLRIWDSNVDQFFWLLVIGSIFYLNWPFAKAHYIGLLAIFIAELLCYLVSYFKFKKPIATHSILAKFWTISLLLFLIDLTLHSDSNIAYYICLYLGLISRLEIVLIILKLNKWTTDVPSIFSASKINKGIPIKKNKLFNG